MRFRASDLFNLNGATPVHNIRGGRHPVVPIRSCREDQRASAPQPFDISLRLGLGRPDTGKLVLELDFKVEPGETITPEISNSSGSSIVRTSLRGKPKDSISPTMSSMRAGFSNNPTAVFGMLHLRKEGIAIGGPTVSFFHAGNSRGRSEGGVLISRLYTQTGMALRE